MTFVYLVVENNIEDSTVHRAYFDRDAAETFVSVYNQVMHEYWEVEEIELGPPNVVYDGPVWVGSWSTRRKLKGEKQLVLVTEDGLTTVVPSAVPVGSMGSYSYQEFFTGPSWRELAIPPEYEDPPVWIDSFHYEQEWHTGNLPPLAAVESRELRMATVRGLAKPLVEQLLKDTARQVRLLDDFNRSDADEQPQGT